MSNFGELKQTVLGCVSRLSSSFQTGATNFVDVAINNALIFTQRQHDFEWNKGVVKIACQPTGNVSLAITEAGDTCKIKRIIKAFGSVQPTRGFDKSIPYLSRASMISDVTGLAKYQTRPCDTAVIHDGKSVFLLVPPSANYELWFYAVKWLPRLVSTIDTNFLFEYGFDFLMYRTLQELNFYLKEDERFPINKSLLQEAWNSLVDWDVSLLSPTETEIDL